jgi:hypothetical protein
MNEMAQTKSKKETWAAVKNWAVVIAGLCVAFGLLVYPHSSRRQPASIPPTRSKTEILRGNGANHLAINSKRSGIVELAIQAPGKTGVAQGTVIDLEASIEAKRDIDEMKYLWILPKDGVHVVSGEVSGEIGHMVGGSPTKLHLSVMSDTDENRQIHLHVYKVVNGENMGNMAQYNTVNQEALEWVAKTKAETLKQNAEKEGRTTVNKIFQ